MPTLYVVGTPIGNLGDMTPRAVEVLRSVALIAAEDTRVTRKLTNHFGIDTPLTSCHQHNEADKGEALAQRMLEEGIDLALTTDAGTPCISDPGYGLVQAAVKRGIPVVAIPGCCAAVCALSISGMDTREFAFYGFLPREKKALREKLLANGAADAHTIFVSNHFSHNGLAPYEELCRRLPGFRVSYDGMTLNTKGEEL